MADASGFIEATMRPNRHARKIKHKRTWLRTCRAKLTEFISLSPDRRSRNAAWLRASRRADSDPDRQTIESRNPTPSRMAWPPRDGLRARYPRLSIRAKSHLRTPVGYPASVTGTPSAARLQEAPSKYAHDLKSPAKNNSEPPDWGAPTGTAGG